MRRYYLSWSTVQALRKIGKVLLVFILLVGICALLVTSCAAPREIVRTDIEYRDTTIIKNTVRDSLIPVPIPLEKDQVITHLGDTSSLETSIARSKAWVDSTGLLHHTLENKHEKTIQVKVPIHSKIIYHGVEHNASQVITKVEYQDKPLSKWKQFRLGAFWWLVSAVLVLLLWTFRKFILKLFI